MSLFNRKSGGVSAAETVTRTIQATGRTLAGDRGGRAANAVTEALGLGRIEICDDPNCVDCAPAK